MNKFNAYIQIISNHLTVSLLMTEYISFYLFFKTTKSRKNILGSFVQKMLKRLKVAKSL